MTDVESFIRNLISQAIRSTAEDEGLAVPDGMEVIIERPRRENQGDYATNVAMLLSRHWGMKPRDVAAKIVSHIDNGDYVDKVEIAGPGFINFFLSDAWMANLIKEILRKGNDYGKADVGKGKKAQVEFVSANPTGPLHIGHGRGAVVGDVTASVLSFAGWYVEREYYINDAGLQMKMLGKSVQSRYFEILGRSEEAPFPEDGYKGDYIYEIAQEIIDREGDKFLRVPLDESLEYFKDFAVKVILDGIKQDLEDFRVRFDVWFSEKSLYERGLIEEMVNFLKQRGLAYEKDGAIWYRSTQFGDEKDRVLIRSTGEPTYFASDVAYHKDKFDRGFDLVIDVWGADHHGYVPRMKAAVQALGKSPDALQILLIQFVSLIKDGKMVPMSTRSGQFVTLREIMDEVGVDAMRYFFLMRKCDSHLDFDIDLAKSASTDNPVYYVQYASARIHSIFKEAASRGIDLADPEKVDFSVLVTEEEKALVKCLARFPEEILKAANELAPHIIVYYVYDLAKAFHSFYNAHRVLGEERPLTDARLLLVRAVQIVLLNVLQLLKINAPEAM
ncbi:arginyl-tRNA synthetase [Acetomicrobium mobile DSM 13181]|uniref:Arginine--tRNA ligase n=1 Tax=Acetomicrobium mobile (strain ATCC BAA-54 / DSM 13181 / JCM 12221 / NGA) TaxID=891968 RepID=I4BUR7_ACEMN|nr:arginine--tRNA ligase [Acetomicrobium mobile]AFM21024.1 arginyl-tRNA synthetase [Acetomicrobium mobile DSM 13181]